MAWVTLCEWAELTDGEAKPAAVDGYRLAVFRDGDRVGVIDDACPHAGASMSRGVVHEGCAICPSHQWAFDLNTGKLRDSDAVTIGHYASRLIDHGGKQFVQADLPST